MWRNLTYHWPLTFHFQHYLPAVQILLKKRGQRSTTHCSAQCKTRRRCLKGDRGVLVFGGGCFTSSSESLLHLWLTSDWVNPPTESSQLLRNFLSNVDNYSVCSVHSHLWRIKNRLFICESAASVRTQSAPESHSETLHQPRVSLTPPPPPPPPLPPPCAVTIVCLRFQSDFRDACLVFLWNADATVSKNSSESVEFTHCCFEWRLKWTFEASKLNVLLILFFFLFWKTLPAKQDWGKTCGSAPTDRHS